MNETFVVGSSFDCSLPEDTAIGNHNTLWTQTMFGCKLLSLLQDMYHFNVTYVIQNETYFDLMSELWFYKNRSVDIFARPTSLRSDVMDITYPVHNLFNWNFGFTIYRPDNLARESHNFYNKPFSPILWHCLCGMAVFCAILFYFFKYWELRLVTGVQWESSFGYEVLMVVGAYCQHIPPIDAVLYSRRGAYFAFFMFAYLVYTFYTSNLLSHLVNDKDKDIDANDILEEYECVVLADVMWIVRNNLAALQDGKNMSIMYKKVFDMKSATIIEGLEAVKTGQTALLSEYDTIEPFIRSVFKNHEICGLSNVDMITNLRKYFFVARDFPYKEEFKVALQRIEETGVLHRLNTKYHAMTECVPLTQVQTQLGHILFPLSLLLATYVLCVIILVGEIVHYKMNRLWPYTD